MSTKIALVIIAAPAMALDDLSKYQDPLFPCVEIAKPSTCWFLIFPL
ncbi:MAG: hypothetical protein QW794_01955 [Thermosphaera sp.]|nr:MULTISPECIES: hypothetical protein [Pyrobaculum]MCX8137488.1 hypothetical protein [Pyrobaculum aerophilum]MCY0890284.1 hypothetical protein [Pyrobaculum arsenaticum]